MVLELAETFPVHVVCEWIGNSAKVAADHYLQVTEDHFRKATSGAAESCAEKALQNPVQQPTERTRMEPQRDKRPDISAISCDSLRLEASPYELKRYARKKSN